MAMGGTTLRLGFESGKQAGVVCYLPRQIFKRQLVVCRGARSCCWTLSLTLQCKACPGPASLSFITACGALCHTDSRFVHSRRAGWYCSTWPTWLQTYRPRVRFSCSASPSPSSRGLSIPQGLLAELRPRPGAASHVVLHPNDRLTLSSCVGFIKATAALSH